MVQPIHCLLLQRRDFISLFSQRNCCIVVCANQGPSVALIFVTSLECVSISLNIPHLNFYNCYSIRFMQGSQANFYTYTFEKIKLGLVSQKLVFELNEFFKQFFKILIHQNFCSSSSPDDCTRNIEIDRVDTPPTFISRESTIINLHKSILNKIYF